MDNIKFEGIQALENMRKDVTRIVALRDEGKNIEEIMHALMREALMSAMDVLLGEMSPKVATPEALDAFAHGMPPGFHPFHGDAMPVGMMLHDDVYVIMADGLALRGGAASFDWSKVRGWKLADGAFIPHQPGNPTMPVKHSARVDVEFTNARMARNVSADNVDWEHATRYRVVTA